MFSGKHGLVIAWIAVVILLLAVSATAQSILTQTSLGTGFVVSSDGYIITNKHVIKGATDITVKIGSKEYKAKVVDSLSDNDIALLKVNAHGLPTVMLGNSDNVQIGDTVYAIGCPAGVCGTITKGRIANLGVPSKTDEGTTLHNLIMTDLTTTHGSSGGPLLNDRGEVIGITTAGVVIQRPTGYETTGFGLSIPINQAIPLLREIPGFSTSQMGRATTVLSLDEIRQAVGVGTLLVQAEIQRSLSDFLPRRALGLKLDISEDKGFPGFMLPSASASARFDNRQISRYIDLTVWQHGSAEEVHELLQDPNWVSMFPGVNGESGIFQKTLIKGSKIIDNLNLKFFAEVFLVGLMNASIHVRGIAAFGLGNLLFVISLEDIDEQGINLPNDGCEFGLGSGSWQEDNGQISLIYEYTPCEDTLSLSSNPPTKEVHRSAINIDDFLHNFQELINTTIDTALAAAGSQ